MTNRNFYSTREAAKLLDVAVSTVQLWVNNGALSAWKTAGGHRRISCSSVDKIVNDQQIISKINNQQDLLNIVIVEDNVQQIRLYKKQFTNSKIKTSIVTAEDGYIGLMKIGTTLPNVIITDLMMPNMDGFKMIDSISKMPELDDTLIIVITGLTKGEIKKGGGLPENVYLFTKPIIFERLEDLLRNKMTAKVNRSSLLHKVS